MVFCLFFSVIAFFSVSLGMRFSHHEHEDLVRIILDFQPIKEANFREES